MIIPKIWQGPAVPEGPYLAAMGFDAVVLCAREHQPRSAELPGMFVVHCPFGDDQYGLSNREYLGVQRCAQVTANLVRQGKQVLITCAAGQNRSGLVTALTLRLLLGISGADAVRKVRDGRPIALTNQAFAEWLSRLPPAPRRR